MHSLGCRYVNVYTFAVFHRTSRLQPMLLPFLSWRMVKLTIDYGFCNDSIVGLATAGHSFVSVCLRFELRVSFVACVRPISLLCCVSSQILFAEDIELACHVGTVGQTLIDESPDRHMLRSRLAREFQSFRYFMGNALSMVPLFSELYHSAMMVGDVESAMNCQFQCWHLEFWTAAVDLNLVSNHIVRFIKEAVRTLQLYFLLRLCRSQELICVSCFASVIVRASTKINFIPTAPCYF